MTRKCISLLLLFMFVLLSPSEIRAEEDFRACPDFAKRMGEIRTIKILMPDVRIYEGKLENNKVKWNAGVRENVAAAFKEVSEVKKIEVVPETVLKGLEKETDAVRSLYRAVSLSIVQHTYLDEHAFAHKKKRFEYSIGPINKLLSRTGGDALVFVYAYDPNPANSPIFNMSSRVGVMVGAMFGGVLGGFMGGLASGANFIPSGEWMTLSVAVIDPNGDVVWFYLKDAVKADFANREEMTKIVREIIADFPHIQKQI